MSSKQKPGTSSHSQTSAKPSAAERTVSLFSGKTAVEEAIEAQRIADAADAKEAEKAREPLSPNKELKPWQARATVHLSGTTQGFRLTETSDGGYVLERICWAGGSTEPYAHGLFVFHKDLLVKLRDAINDKLQSGTEDKAPC